MENSGSYYADLVNDVVADLLEKFEDLKESLLPLAGEMASRADLRAQYQAILDEQDPTRRFGLVEKMVAQHGPDYVQEFLSKEGQLYLKRKTGKNVTHNLEL